MISIDNIYSNELIKYFSKKVYDTNEILKEENKKEKDKKYKDINSNIKNFLIDLSFEKNGKIALGTLMSKYENNTKIIEDFFTKLETKFSSKDLDVRDVFLKSNDKTPCDYNTKNIKEKVVCIKKFILNKYNNMYKNLRNKHGKKLIEIGGLHICPYCSRNYIGVIESIDGSKSITPDLDHFYPKSRYPFLGITISNFVPSCLFCNQRAKSDEDFYKNSAYPPNKIFNDIEFDFDVYLNKIYIKNYANLIKIDGYKILLDTFLIQETYATHSEILKSIVNKTQKYKKSKIDDISKYTVGLSSTDIKKIVFYEYEFMNKKKELLYKMKKDLYRAIVK